MNSNYIIILGRQAKLGLAELERRFGADSVSLVNDTCALLQTDLPVDINTLGGSVKIAHVQLTGSGSWLGLSKQAVKHMQRELSATTSKVTLGVSAYGFDVGPREVQKTGLIIKSRVRDSGGSLRLIPNTDAALSSAQVFHNKLAGGTTKRELILVSATDGRGYVAETIGVQDIDAYTLRDRGRPKRDPLNGMLPPKLAQTMINLGAGQNQSARVLDPFCGTGVVLMESALMRHPVYGSDVNEKMIVFTRDNLNWLKATYNLSFDWYIHQADATTATWQQPIDAVISETYLGEPMAQAPTPEKLAKVMAKCEDIVRKFLANISPQLEPGTSLCIAVPAWRIAGSVNHLQVVDDLGDLGYNWIDFEHVDRSDLIYYREDQIVARELLVITKK